MITVSAIVFAVVASVFMQSMNRGSHEVMIDNMVRFHTGYIQLQDYRYEDESSLDNSFHYNHETEERIKRVHNRIGEVLPRIETFMLAGDDASIRGALVLGIDPDKEHAFNRIRDHLTEGSFFGLNDQTVVVSEGLARRLGLGVGDQLLLLGQGRFGMTASGLFEIAGLMQHPLRDMNNQTVYMALPAAQNLLSADEYVTAALIELTRENAAGTVAAALSEEFADDNLIAWTWPELIPELLQLLEFDLVGAYFMSGVLYLVIGFGFFGTILTMTLERMREFGVLLSVGMSRRRLASVVFLETLFISIIGVAAGVAAAWLIIYYFYLNPVQLTGDVAETVIEMGWDPVLPMSFAADQFYMQGIIVFLLAMVVFLFPLVKVFKLNILEAARR